MKVRIDPPVSSRESWGYDIELEGIETQPVCDCVCLLNTSKRKLDKI